MRAIRCDLADTANVEKILDELEKLEIGMLVFNAAAADCGPWLEVPLARNIQVVSVERPLAPLAIVDRLSRKMAARGRGGIILTSSMSALHGAPRQGVYAATKAFDLILGETLWAELAEHGVDALAFVQGMVNTPRSFVRTRCEPVGDGADATRGAGAGRGRSARCAGQVPELDSGRVWRAAAVALTKIVPRRLSIRFTADQHEKQFGKS